LPYCQPSPPFGVTTTMELPVSPCPVRGTLTVGPASLGSDSVPLYEVAAVGRNATPTVSDAPGAIVTLVRFGVKIVLPVEIPVRWSATLPVFVTSTASTVTVPTGCVPKAIDGGVTEIPGLR